MNASSAVRLVVRMRVYNERQAPTDRDCKQIVTVRTAAERKCRKAGEEQSAVSTPHGHLLQISLAAVCRLASVRGPAPGLALCVSRAALAGPGDLRRPAAAHGARAPAPGPAGASHAPATARLYSLPSKAG